MFLDFLSGYVTGFALGLIAALAAAHLIAYLRNRKRRKYEAEHPHLPRSSYNPWTGGFSNHH
jgi:hypothetical protein